MVEAYPDSTSLFLAQIIYPDKMTERQKADYGYLTALSHSLSNKAIVEDGIIIYTLGYYKDFNVTDKLAKTYMLASEYYKWNEDHTLQMNMLFEGLDFSLEMKDSSMISRFNYAIGHFHYERKEYDEAIHFFNQTVNFANNPYAFYMIGLSCFFAEKVDLVDFYMKQAIDISIQQDKIYYATFFKRNYADILCFNGRYNEALNLHKQIMGSAEIDTKYLSTLSIVQLYLDIRQPDSAQVYIDSARIIYSQYQKLYPDLLKLVNDNELLVLEAITDYAQGKRITLVQFHNNNDERRMQEREKEKLIEEKIELKNRLVHQNLMLTIDRQRILLYITWGMVFLSLTLVSAFLYLRRKRMRWIDIEEKREVLEKLLNETVTATEKNSSFFKKVLLQQLGLIKIVASTPTSHNQELLKQVSLINNADLQVDNMLAWDDLFKLIDSIYNGFYSILTTKYGNILTDKEKQLCCLLCAGFSTKEISVINQQGIQTIYQRKTTIRQKLKMEEKEDIVGFIRDQ